jgi:hypothetical protein
VSEWRSLRGGITCVEMRNLEGKWEMFLELEISGWAYVISRVVPTFSLLNTCVSICACLEMTNATNISTSLANASSYD